MGSEQSEQSLLAPRLLLLEDDEQVRKNIRAYLKRCGMLVFEANTVEQALKVAAEEDVDMAILDHGLPDGTAFDFLRKRAKVQRTPSIVFSAAESVELAVEAMKLGAENFLAKPVKLEVLKQTVEVILKRRGRGQGKTAAFGRTVDFNPFVGESPAIARVEELARAVVEAEVSVMILGETGTGKSVLARWLHENGPRKDQAFVDLNCAGLSKELAEDDLFGHQRGAFTGATGTKPGLLEVGHGGDVFLDEVGDLDLAVQPKLLKVLEEKTFRRVGDVQNRRADVRIISATHRDLPAMCEVGSFRHDLLFRLNTVTFHLPSLRERREDLLPLAERLVLSLCARTGQEPPRLSTRAQETLKAYHWPGNMRELRNVLERALLFSPSETIEDLVVTRDPSRVPVGEGSVEGVLSLVEAEKRHIETVLRAHDQRVDDAAKALQIPRSSLYAKIKKYDLR